MSTVPEITEDEATPNTPPIPENSAQTENSQNQKPDQNETAKQDVPKTDNTNPKQETTNINPQNEPPKQDSTTNTPQNTPPSQETVNTQAIFNGQNPSSLPLLFISKGKKPQIKNPVSPQNTAYVFSKEDMSKSIAADITYIMEESKKLDKYKDLLQIQVNELSETLEELKREGNKKEFHSLQKEVTKLKLQIPSKHKGDADDKDPHKTQQASGSSRAKQKAIPERVLQQMPQLYKSSLFENCLEYKDIKALFHKLPVDLKLCLMCFAVFPENAIIKKRLMVYWWMAEGFVPPIPRTDEIKKQIAEGTTAEQFADDFFDKFTKMGFIEPVNKKRSLSVGCYKMHPFVRLALVLIAEKSKFFDFDEEGEPTQKFSETCQACLVGRGLIDYRDLRAGKVKVQDLEKLHAVINVNEPILEFKANWLLNMKNVIVLYLGRWQVSATHHIEIEDEEEDFLDGLWNMAHLRFFSLQGVSRIMALPESVSKLSNLVILDLRACHNLESVPDGIGSLRNLTHLDISECYLLEHMPKGIALLSELQVLKGFVIGAEKGKHSCTLEDLAKLKYLIKLSIYTGLPDFPTNEHIYALQKFKKLRKLTIAWGGGALQVQSSKTSNAAKPDDGGERKRKPNDAGERKENTKEKPGGGALQGQSSETSAAAKQDDAGESKDYTNEKQEGAALQAEGSKNTSEAPKIDDGAETEDIEEEQGGDALQAEASKNISGKNPKASENTSEASNHDGGERQDNAEEKEEEGVLQAQLPTESDGGESTGSDALQAESDQSTPEASKPNEGGERKEKPTEKSERGALAAESSKTYEAPESDDEEDKEKDNSKEKQGGDDFQTKGSKSTSEALQPNAKPVEPDDGGPKTDTTEKRDGDALQAELSKSTSHASKPDDGGERKENATEITKGEALQAQSSKTYAAPKPDQGGHEKKDNAKDKSGVVAPHAQSYKTKPKASKPDDGGDRKKDNTNEKSRGSALQTKFSKNSKEAPKPDDRGEQKNENAKVKPAKTFGRVLTFGRKPTLQLEKLKKLDLKSFPQATTPDWLKPSTLTSLEKLYIRGGKFSDLGQYQDLDGSTKHTWKVKTLRLKYLTELEMDWRELQALFPDLIYLEKVNCPKLSFFPNDGYGVWINKEKLKQMQERK